jgi:hypothetical protein
VPFKKVKIKIKIYRQKFCSLILFVCFNFDFVERAVGRFVTKLYNIYIIEINIIFFSFCTQHKLYKIIPSQMDNLYMCIFFDTTTDFRKSGWKYSKISYLQRIVFCHFCSAPCSTHFCKQQ